MPSLVSDLTSSAITLSRAASMAARISSMVAVRLLVTAMDDTSYPPEAAGETAGNCENPQSRPRAPPVRVVASGFVPARQDPQRGGPGALARGQDQPLRSHPPPDRRHPAARLPGGGHLGARLRA